MHGLRFMVPIIVAVATTVVLALAPTGVAQNSAAILEPEEAAAQLTRAQAEAVDAEQRAARLLAEADSVTRDADRAAREAAALAAQIQQTEAQIAIAQAEFSLAQSEREQVAEALAQRRRPLVQLTAALQTMAQRPTMLSALQPGSLRETVYVRAVLDGAVPIVRDRTTALRSDLERGLALEREAARALASINASEAELRQRRSGLEELAVQRRLASRTAQADAARERDRALVLAEEARDLDGLVDELTSAALLREQLAALPGPILRPVRPVAAEVLVDREPTSEADAEPITISYQLPVQGRIVQGYGEQRSSGLRSNGLTITPSEAAQVVAPAPGRVAFSGPYRGFDRIIIIEHPGGWTSLITGLERTSVEVGESLLAGSPLGNAANSAPSVTIELRRDGEPINPLNFIG